jgi:hypothetical protein
MSFDRMGQRGLFPCWSPGGGGGDYASFVEGYLLIPEMTKTVQQESQEVNQRQTNKSRSKSFVTSSSMLVEKG